MIGELNGWGTRERQNMQMWDEEMGSVSEFCYVEWAGTVVYCD